MPCTYYLPGEEQAVQRQELDRLAAMLCSLCREVERVNKRGKKPIALPADVAAWWAEHKKLDARREAKDRQRAEYERERAADLAKLTPEERKAIGIP